MVHRHVSYWTLLLVFESIALIAGFAVTTTVWALEKYVFPGAMRFLR